MEFGEQTIEYQGKVVFIRLTMPSFNRTLKQYVADEACFMFVNKGEVGVRAPNEYLTLTPKQGMLAKCLNYFFEPSKDSNTCDDGIDSVGVFLYPSLVEELFGYDLSKSTHTLDYNVKQVQIDKLLTLYRQSIEVLLENPDLVDENVVKTKLKEFILLMVKSQDAPSQLDFLSALFRPKESSFQSVIKQNLYANLSIPELALLTHLSLSSFKRKFQEEFQEAPKKYLNRKKIEKARELLKDESSRVSDIAYDVGYDSLATFNRNFSSIVGTSPSHYRMSQNEDSLG